MKTLIARLTQLLFLLLTTTILATTLHAQGKRVYVGIGSGYLDYPNAQSTLNLHDDDTIFVNAGKYQFMNFGNITASAGHKIYIMNSGQVELTYPIFSSFNNLTNVEVRGDGTPGIDFGFYIHDVLRGLYLYGTLQSVTFSYFKMYNVGDYGIFVANSSIAYNGSNASVYYDLKFLHFNADNLSATFLQIGNFTRIAEDGLINFTKNLEFAYCNISNTTQVDVLRLNKVLNANVHDNHFFNINLNDSTHHSGVIYLYGTGNIHNNTIKDYRAQGLRAHAISLDVVGAINVYDNIMVNGKKYSGVECYSTLDDYNSSPLAHYCNFKIYNNTFGNLSAGDFITSMADTYDANGGTIEIKNNLGFNLSRDQPYNPAKNYIYNREGPTLPDTGRNMYSQTFGGAGLADDVNCFLNAGSPAIDKGLTLPLVTNDIDGITRPQGSAYDIGAREFQSSVVFPVARAGADTSTTLPKDSITLNGSASSNPTGGVLTYKWSQISGPSSAVIRTDTSVRPVFKNLVQGTYQVKLVVTNSQSRSSNDTIVIVVSGVPVFPPVAKAGGTTTITLPVNSTGLNGAGSTSTGGVLKYVWTKISGPSSFVISGDSTATPFVSSLTAGTYKIKLSVSDTNRLTGLDTATVVVQPAPVPTANAGPDVNLILPANSTTLSGSASTSNGGSALKYVWTKVSGPASFSISGDSTVTASVSNLTEGTYQIKLTVTNTGGNSSTDFLNIIVAAAPVATANAGADINLTLPVNSTQLNGTASSTTGGGALTYQWALVSGPSSFTISGATTATPTVSNLAQGTYQIKLTVTNVQGSSAVDLVAVTVSAMVVYVPVSNAGADVSITLPVSSAILNGDQSYNPGGGTITYAWSRISGPASFTITGQASATPTVSNLTEGAYLLQLKVTNDQGSSSQDTVKVTVNPVPPSPPVANAGADISISLPVNSTALNGSGSSNAAGGTLIFLWSQTSGPSSSTITGASTATPSVSNLVQGTYQIKLKVTNAQGLSAEDIVSITVNAAVYPVASTGTSLVSLVLPANSITLNGGSSYDPGGGTLSYNWSKLSGPDGFTIAGSTTATPFVSNLMMGSYQVQLTVTNNVGLSSSAIVGITVTPSLLSVPVAGKDTTINFPNGYAILNGSSSYGTGGATIMHYHWQQLTGPTTSKIENSEVSKTSATNLEPGVYVFQLSITDSYGQNTTTTFKVTVVSLARYVKSISLYPNPCTDMLHIHAVSDSTGPVLVRITNMAGVIMLTQKFEKSQLVFDQSIIVSRLTSGMYIIEMLMNEKVQLIDKFIKR